MKLSSKNSFLKRITCIVLSAMLCLTSFTLAGFVPTLEAEAQTGAEIDTSDVTNATTKYPSVSIAGGSGLGYASDWKAIGYTSCNTDYYYAGTKYVYEVHTMFAKDVVWIYTGSGSYTCPISLKFHYYNTGGKTKERGLNAIVNNSSDFSVTNSWVGKQVGNNDAPTESNNYFDLETKTFSVDADPNAEYKDFKRSDTKSKKYFQFSNYLTHAASSDSAKAPATYATYKYDITTYNNDGWSIGNFTSEAVTQGNAESRTWDIVHQNSVYARMINVTELEDALKNAKKAVESKNHYTSASVQALVSAVSTAKLDYSSSDLSTESGISTMSTEVRNAASTINNAVNNLKIEHSGGTATCTSKAKCSVCTVEYGEIDPNNHDYGSATQITTEEDVYGQKRTLQKHSKTCSRCNDVLVENHDLTISGVKATCSENCGYSVESNYKSNGFRITKGNLFDFDAYADSQSARISPSQGTVSVDKENDTITVAGNAYDAYTYYAAKGDLYYRIPVSQLQWYTISYTPSNDSNQVYAFFSDGESVDYDTSGTWNAHMYDAEANKEFKLTFKAPENCRFVDFRFGTVKSGAICTFSDISFYESDQNGDPTNGYEVLAKNVPSGKKVLESFDFPTADKCKASYDMKEKDGEIGPEHIIDTNLNITFDPNHSYDSREVNGNTLTIKCSVCQSTYTIDLTAYNSAVTQAQASIADVKVYTNTSRTELSNVLTKQEELFSSAKTQNEVNACATAIVTANKIKDGDNGGLLEYLTYKVTFIIQDETSSNTVIKIKEEPHHYGDIVNMNVDEGNVYKWTKTTINSEGNPVEIKYADNATSTSYVVNENATIIAYLSPVQEASTTNVKIILKDKTDRISGIAYATNGTITLNDTYIAVGDTKLYSKSVTYYNAKGYTINGVVVSGQYTIPEGVTEIVLRPIYVAGSTLQIDCDTATSINGKNVTSYQAKWDEPITIKASGEVIWYTLSGDKEIILAQGDTYKFRANESIKIYTKVVPETNVAPSVKIGYFDYDVELNKVTVVNNFFVPSGMEVKSAGVILSTKTNNIETLKKQTGGRFSVTPDKFTENGNQVRISVSRTANTPFTMHALAYVEFQDGTVCYADEIATCQYSPKQV